MNTILERDLKLIIPTTLGYRQLRNLAALLASKSGYPLELSALSRETRISIPTLRKLISAFEAIYLIRVIRGGLVPLCFRQGKDVLGVIPSLEQTPSDSSLGSARSFLKTYPSSKVVIVHTGHSDQCLSKRLRVIGAAHLI